MSTPLPTQPFPPATKSPRATSSDQTHVIWIAALALPLVIVVSGILIAYLCWRRLRVNPEQGRWKQIDESPPSSNDHGQEPLPPITRPFARPLVLLARTSSTPPIHLASVPRRPGPPTASSTFSFPTVSTRISPAGTRVLTKKKEKIWPPTISLPLEVLNQNQDRSKGGGAVVVENERNSSATGADLQRGPSLVSGYKSQSGHQRQDHLEQLVEEAAGCQHSWTQGDDELDQHFSAFSNLEQQAQHRKSRLRPRARSLSSRSLSEYSTMGASTLGNLIDREVARISAVQNDFESTSLRSTDLSIAPLPVADLRPLSIERPRTSSADLYSLRPISYLPFPRLAPLNRSASRPDLPTTPSTFYTVNQDDFRLPPPLPYEGFSTSHFPLPPVAPIFPSPPPSAWLKKHTHQRDDHDLSSQSQRAALQGGGETAESLIEWRQGNSQERRKEREVAQKVLSDW